MDKAASYAILNRQLSAILENEYDMIANMANASALLFQTMTDINWAGFYLYKDNELILGPFQGNVACMHIPIGKGVCGSAALHMRSLLVEDVHKFPGHIACDSNSRSEIVIPIMKQAALIAVLDIDSPMLKRFDENDAQYLQEFVRILENTFI